MGKLSVIIATINDSIATNLTIAQIVHQLEQDKIGYEIIIVDNGSSEEERANLDRFMDFHKEFPIRIYDFPTKGTIPPHSFGATKAKYQYITMPDPHMVFSAHYFKRMIETLREYKPMGFEVVFSPFSVATLVKNGGDVVCGSELLAHNPFARPNGIGPPCKISDKPHPVLSNTMSGFVAERKWFLEIGNMFPEAFEKAGGHTAESLLIGITTWMFGKKCLLQPEVFIEHPVYRTGHGAGWSADMHLSMATGAYILGGQEYLDKMEAEYGKYVEGDLEDIPNIAKDAREYVDKNAEMTLEQLIEDWEKLRVV